MIAYLDTEFSNFFNAELLSIGLVDDDGRELYDWRTATILTQKNRCCGFGGPVNLVGRPEHHLAGP